MSNAMSISKSRWKGALLATVAASVLTPLAANAQTTPGSMTLSLSLAPMGNVINSGAFGTEEYIAPDTSYPIYVYATVAENGNVSSSNVAGLQYAYFNVLQNYAANLTGVNSGGINVSDGVISKATTSPLFSAYGSQNGSSGVTLVTPGTNPGIPEVNPVYSGTGFYAVGSGVPIAAQGAPLTGVASASTMSLMGKARSTSPVWSNSVSGSGDGTNIYISGNTVSFLLETLTYTPTNIGKAKSFFDPNLGENTFTVTVPNLPSSYAGSNYFTGNPSGTTGSEHNGSVGTSYTHSVYTAGSVTVGSYTFSNTVSMYDAAVGDAFLDGYIAEDSLDRIGANYGEIFYGAGNVISGWTNGDYFGDGYVGEDSLDAEGSAYGSGLADPNSGAYGPLLAEVEGNGNGPFAVGSPTALIGGSSVPEPASLSLLALASLGLTLGRRSRKSV